MIQIVVSLVFFIMLFSKSVIVFAGVGIVSAGGPAYQDIASVPSCEREVVMELGSKKFLEYVLTHCKASAGPSGVVLTGDPDPGVEGCLANFIAATPMTHPIPPNGACRETVQKFVSDLVSVDMLASLSYDSIQLTFGDDFFTTGAVTPITSFQIANQFSVAYPSCTGAMVRAMAVNLAYETLVKGAADAAPVTYGLSVSDVKCDHCYRMFDAVIKMGTYGIDSDTVLKALCLVDPHDAMCKKSTVVQRAMFYFRNCAGYDIEFMGPVCTAEQLAPIDRMNPHPYIPLMICKFDADSFSDVCNDVEGYIAELSEVSGSTDCGGCFTSFYENIVVTDATRSACAGGNYGTPICIASQQSAHIQFQACTGSFMTIPK
jgi:hypothetical protein